ncbi:MAG: hypothetical protein Q8S33_14645 [Myxococcales bacterium]|nr:hypothetical protein [Myxococcales bacterium]MDP3501580.1 hypothetical protein [Myxococcales bacterium]
MKSTLLCTCVVVLVASACATTPGGTTKTEKVPGHVAADYFPLKLGTAWEYEAAMLGEKRVLPVKIVKVFDGLAEDSTGARLLADAWGVRDERRYLLRNPIENGTKWNNVVSPSSVEGYEIVAVEQPCEAPAGKWEGCVIVESKNRIDASKTLVNEMTLAPGVGIVRMATTLEDGGKRLPQSKLTLLKFTPAP